MPARALFRETLAALMAPRRLIPIVLVCLPLVAAQGRFSGDPMAVPLAIVTCLAFVLVAPACWRWLLRDPLAVGAAYVGPLMIYGVIG
ncbi:MAG TPA: sensor histidine kinase, partial [Polyangia bacterium]|nr:sensor histidine kinase [Polyangia bacterium]